MRTKYSPWLPTKLHDGLPHWIMFPRLFQRQTVSLFLTTHRLTHKKVLRTFFGLCWSGFCVRAANLVALHGKHMAAIYCVLLFRFFCLRCRTVLFRLMAVYQTNENAECIEIFTTRLCRYITAGCCCWMLPTWHFVLLLIKTLFRYN